MARKKFELGPGEPTDYEIMVRIKSGDIAAKAEMFNRYRPLVYKMKRNFNLRKEKLKDAGKGLDSSNYEYDCYEYFQNALNYIDLNKIPENKQQTWKAYVAFHQYLSNYNRDTIAHYIKRRKNEVPFEYTTDTDSTNRTFTFDNQIIENNDRYKLEPDREFEVKWNALALQRAINECVSSKFNSNQLQIWKIRSTEKKTITEICKILNLKSKDYHLELNNMKEILKKEYVKNLKGTGAEQMYFLSGNKK